MRLVLWILSLLVGCVIAGCQGDRDVDNALLCADEMMEKMPDSALKVMESIDPKRVYGGSQRARYALLLTQARYKNFIDETDDSLISVATSYYNHEEDIELRLRANFLRARILENANNHTSSIVFALHAEQAALKLGDSLWLARIYEMIADIYNDTYNAPLELENRIKAIWFYEKSGNRSLHDWNLIPLIKCYANQQGEENVIRALELLDSVSDNGMEADRKLSAALISSYLYPLFITNQHVKLRDMFNSLSELDSGDYVGFDDYILMSRSYILTNQIDSAEFYLQKASELEDADPLSIEMNRFLILKAQNSYKDALEKYIMISEVQDSIVEEQLKQSVLSSQSNYHELKAKREQIRAKKASRRTFWITIVLITIIVLLSLYVTEKIKLKNYKIQSWVNEVNVLSANLDESLLSNRALSKELEDAQNSVAILNKKLDEQITDSKVLNSVVKDLFTQHFNTLNMLCNEYMEKNDTNIKTKLSIYSSIKSEIDKMSAKSELMKLEEITNKCNFGVIDRLRAQMPELKESDVVFLMLIFAGLAPRAIALISDISYSNYYTKRRRLKAKIESSSAPDKKLFLSLI